MSAWDAESGNWGPSGDGAGGGAPTSGPGYAETKEGGGATTVDGDGANVVNWPSVPSEKAMTQGPASEPSAVPTATPGDGAAEGAAHAYHARAAMTAHRHRHTMAFEIARLERAGKASPPNPQRAAHVWALSRPRYVERPDQPGRRMRLLPGEEHRDAVPYGVWNTSWAQMGDFGLDVGMYFVTIAQLTGATLVYAALSVVAMVHFSSEQYSGKQVRHIVVRVSGFRITLGEVGCFDNSFECEKLYGVDAVLGIVVWNQYSYSGYVQNDSIRR